MSLLNIKLKKLLQKHYELTGNRKINLTRLKLSFSEKELRLRVHRNEQLQFKYRVYLRIWKNK